MLPQCLQEILPLLKNARHNGKVISASCPCHDDQKNSLSVWEEKPSEPFFKCHVGCNYRHIKTALGLSINGNGTITVRTIIATYDYTDENGLLLYQAVRYQPKDFKQRRPDGNGGWIWDLKNTPRVLYRLPELQEAEFVFFVEGERDVETLRRHGFTATCNPMGAGKWRSEYTETLHGKIVVIIPDNDEPGRRHAEQVTNGLYGIAKEVMILHLPNLPEKGDVTDFFQNGGTTERSYEISDEKEGAIRVKRRIISFNTFRTH